MRAVVARDVVVVVVDVVDAVGEVVVAERWDCFSGKHLQILCGSSSCLASTSRKSIYRN